MAHHSFKSFVRRFVGALLRPVRIAVGTRGIAVRLERIEAALPRLGRIEGELARLGQIEAELGGAVARVVTKMLDERIDALQQWTAGLQRGLAVALVTPLQHYLDETIRNVVGPLLATTVQGEMRNLNLQIDRLIRLNAPVILPSLTNGHESYQSMVKAFLRRLKPKAALSVVKKSLGSTGLPRMVILSTEPRKPALFRALPRHAAQLSGLSAERQELPDPAESVKWSDLQDHELAEFPSDISASALKEALSLAH